MFNSIYEINTIQENLKDNKTNKTNIKSQNNVDTIFMTALLFCIAAFSITIIYLLIEPDSENIELNRNTHYYTKQNQNKKYNTIYAQNYDFIQNFFRFNLGILYPLYILNDKYLTDLEYEPYTYLPRKNYEQLEYQSANKQLEYKPIKQLEYKPIKQLEYRPILKKQIKELNEKITQLDKQIKQVNKPIDKQLEYKPIDKLNYQEFKPNYEKLEYKSITKPTNKKVK